MCTPPGSPLQCHFPDSSTHPMPGPLLRALTAPCVKTSSTSWLCDPGWNTFVASILLIITQPRACLLRAAKKKPLNWFSYQAIEGQGHTDQTRLAKQHPARPSASTCPPRGSRPQMPVSAPLYPSGPTLLPHTEAQWPEQGASQRGIISLPTHRRASLWNRHWPRIYSARLHVPQDPWGSAPLSHRTSEAN